jgi:hypothetical protein
MDETVRLTVPLTERTVMQAMVTIRKCDKNYLLMRSLNEPRIFGSLLHISHY